MARKKIPARKRIFRPRNKEPGLPPGTLVFTGEKSSQPPRVRMLDYDEHKVVERELRSAEECTPFKDDRTVTWIDVDSMADTRLLEGFGRVLGFHALMLEDILNTDQRPKFEDFGNYVYIVVKMLDYNAARGEMEIEQLSLVLGPDYVITFQERPGDFFDPVRERIRNSLGRIRKLGTDYLAYVLLDLIVDHYFVVLERLGEKIEQLEDMVSANPGPTTGNALHALRREMIFVRRSTWPLRDVIANLQRSESDLIHDTNAAYFRDLQDHSMQVTDTVDSFRDLLNGVLDTYYATLTNRTNAVLKVLALFSAIFMPLTFITGIFGMNFVHFPELEWRYGFQGSLILMGIVIVIMVGFFRWKKWL